MAQHDNGRRNAGQQSGAWQEHRAQQDLPSGQQEQSSGRYGSSYGGQQGSGQGQGGSHGQHDQWEQGRQQQGDNWRERQGFAAGGSRPAMEERDRGWNERGQGGQASDNDYGNRGITESGNFGNHGGMAGRGQPGGAYGQTYGQGGSHDQGGQSAQRFGGYSQGYDARSDSTGGYGSSNFGPDQGYGSGNYGGGDWNAGSYGPGGGGGRERNQGGGRGFDSTYGQSSADNYQGNRGWQGQGGGQGQGGWQGQHPSNRDRYGDNGYQGNWQQGQRGGQAYHDPDYHQWRSEQLSKLDRDYDEWRQQRYQRFSDDFDKWRSDRDDNRSAGRSAQSDPSAQGAASDSAGGGTRAGSTGHQATAGETSGMQASTSKHDISSAGDKGTGKTATK